MKNLSMSWLRPICLSLIGALGIAVTANAQTAPKPLFTNDNVIKIQIEAPFKKLIAKSERSTDPYPAILRLKDGTLETHAITVAARGKSRRRKENCKFPPLRVRFNDKAQFPALFAKQKSLKLVTHCQKASKSEQTILLEYSAYRLYNEITPQSLKVRLAEIEYIESKSRKPIVTRYGFFIEDMDDAAKRNGMKEIDQEKISKSQLKTDTAIRTTLFHYLISNVDWSLSRGPVGSDCCHNSKLMGYSTANLQNLVSVPYDFDQSGLVDADYAVTHESLPIKNVRQRLYRGFCRDNAQAKIESQKILQKRSRLMAVFDSIQGLDGRKREKAKAYISNGFDDLSDPAKFEKRIIDRCR